jgi:hypothetical protein
MAQRVKGLECSLALSTPDGAAEEAFDDIIECELNMDMEILEKAYLGQVGSKFDDLFKGFSGSIKTHMEGSTFFKLAEKIQDRATRRTPADGVFSLSFTLNFPSGTKARLTAEDIYFGTIPMKMAGQSEYVECELPWKGSTLRRIL